MEAINGENIVEKGVLEVEREEKVSEEKKEEGCLTSSIMMCMQC